MTTTQAAGKTEGIGDAVARTLPYLRRYARALTGSQTSGDAYAAATLEAILDDSVAMQSGARAKVSLFKAFHSIWSSSGRTLFEPETTRHQRAWSILSTLTVNSREALLLSAIERFSTGDIAEILSIERDEAEALLDRAMRDMADGMVGKVMIIEDEPLIAMDIEAIVTELGHKPTGIARTRAEAVKLAARERPDLILADIQLADNSSGIDAVNDILRALGDVPVIFITAFPERLLTGDRPEPAFLITKPFSVTEVRTAVSQALFFSSTDALTD